MQVRDDGDLHQIYEVPVMVVNYEYMLKLEPTTFADKLNRKRVLNKKVKNKYSKVLD